LSINREFADPLEALEVKWLTVSWQSEAGCSRIWTNRSPATADGAEHGTGTATADHAELGNRGQGEGGLRMPTNYSSIEECAGCVGHSA
jgi:hypothetical protein